MNLLMLFKKIFGRKEDVFSLLEKKGCFIPLSTRPNMHSPYGIDHLFLYLVEIGENCVISTRVTFLAHDASTSSRIGLLKIGIVKIGNNVFVGHKVTILCGSIIGDNCIIGANSLVNSDLKPNGVYAGNPARFICSVDDYCKKKKNESLKSPIFKNELSYWDYEKNQLDCLKMKKELLSRKRGYIDYKK